MLSQISPAHTKQQTGFTLMEVILVMALIGLIMSTVSYTVFSSNIEEDIEKEVQRLQVVTSLASDYAVINQQELGLLIDEEKRSYEYLTLNEENEWEPLLAHKYFELRELPESLFLELNLDGLAWQEDESLFDSRIFDEQLSVSEEGVEIGNEEDLPPPPPQIMILSSGEITPFELKLKYSDDDDEFYYLLSAKDTIPLEREGPL
ncbi:type II secretion system minor pseudopilin GspH [Glaciecola sp. 2405UD65-10]|uniref:type II secretion system minor pseudopilin GspH n=1 Tax=Glaciecola sp. 2405UD65-10 TaxID=3397244 RepID=UPI003B599246